MAARLNTPLQKHIKCVIIFHINNDEFYDIDQLLNLELSILVRKNYASGPINLGW